MKTFSALVAIAVFTSLVGFVLVTLGVEQHHTNPVWAIGTSIVF